jgi:F-type H+-transporting ATPase subunit b
MTHYSAEGALSVPTGELIIGLIAFACVVAVLLKFVFPKMEQTFAERRDAIEGGLKRAEEAQAQAQAALEHYNAQLADARGEAAQIRENARAEAQRIVDEMRESAHAEAQRITQRGEEQLQAQRRQVVADLRAEIGQLSVQLAGRIVGESMEDDARRRGTVDRFLDEMDQMSGAQPAAVTADESTVSS